MLDPHKFKVSEPGAVNTLKVERLTINEHEWLNVEVPLHYRADWKVVVDLTDFVAEKSKGAGWPDWDNASITLRHGTAVVELFIISSPLFIVPDGPRLLATPFQEPMIIGDQARCQKLKFVLLDPPNFRDVPIHLTDREGQTFKLRFPSFDSGFMIVSANLQGGRQTLDSLSSFIDFMTFLKGAHCGIGHGLGYDEDGKLCLQAAGFNRHDTSEGRYSWFLPKTQSALPKLYSIYSAAYACGHRSNAIFKAIGLYRASNEAQGISIELAIISAHTALECLVYYILEKVAGWSQRLIKDSKEFSDKLRAALSFVRLDLPVYEYSPNVVKVARQKNLVDGLAALSFIRNKLVHQDQTYVPEARDLHEAWLLMQWLVEVFIFAIIGHSGEFRDRRIYEGRSKTCYVNFAG